MAIVNEVITQFSFQGSTSPLSEYNASLGKSIGLLAAAAAGIVAAAGAMGKFVLSTTQALDPMIQLSRVTDTSVEAIQELGYAASVTGSDLNAVQSTVGQLSAKIGEAAQKGSEEFARLGISVRKANGDIKSSEEVLLEVGQRFDQLGLSMAERRSFAESLGIDPSLVQLLSLTGGQIDELRQKARDFGVVTKEQADAAASLNDSMTTMKFAFEAVKNSIAVGLAPQIEDITGGFTEFLAANKDIIKEGITKVIEVVTALAKAVVRLTPVIAGIAAVFGVWKVASIGLAGVLGAIFTPVTIIVAAIAALLLIVDDLIVALDGGKSVIRDFFLEFLGFDIVPPMRAALDTIKAFFDDFITAAGNVANVFSDLFKSAFALITGDFDKAGEHFVAFFDGVADIFKNGISKLITEISVLGNAVFEMLTGMNFSEAGELIAKKIVDPIREAFTSMFDWIGGAFSAVGDMAGNVASFFGFGGDDEPSASPQTQPMLFGAPSLEQMSLQPAPISNNSTSRNVTIEQQNQFTISGSDGRGIANTVTDSLQDQLDDAETQLGSGAF